MKTKKQEHLKLNAVKFGFAGGVLCGLCVFLMTLLALAWPEYGNNWVGFIYAIYSFLGYKVSFLGAILGAIYAFIDGFIFAWVFALIYNCRCWCGRR